MTTKEKKKLRKKRMDRLKNKGENNGTK